MSQGLVLSFLRRAPLDRDWTQQELAEFYRVESALLQAGLSVITDRGVSDEGEPWFVFCRADNEEVIAHFARINGEYVVVSNIYSGAARGRDFRLLVRQMLDMQPGMLPVRRQQGRKIYLHPAALLTALLASAYLLASDHDLSGDQTSLDADGKGGILSWLQRQKFNISAVVVLAIAWLDHQTDVAAKLLDFPLFSTFSDHDSVHVATAGHDGAPLDVMHAIKPFDVALHRIDLSKQVVLSNLQDQGAETHNAPTVNPTTHVAQASGGEKAPDANAAHAMDDLVNLSNGPGHLELAQGNNTDSAAIAGNLETAILTKGVIVASEADMVSSSTGSVTPSAAIIDVLQAAASESGGTSAQPIVLSSTSLPLAVALQEAFTHIGFGSDLVQAVVSTPAEGTGAPISVSQPTLAVSSPAPASGATEASAPLSDNQVLHLLEGFERATPSTELFLSGPNVIVVDANAADAKSPDYASHTFAMSDGSTVTVVGILPQHAALAA
jgi:hypothetical protein